MSKDKIGDRMKDQYENRTKQFLTRRLPTIIRLDGKAFHTYTKGLNKPFDEGLIEDMQNTTVFLCENIQGCKLGYTQSDEITLVLTDYDNLQTDAWFDYNVQKMTSISAAMATAKFNELRRKRVWKQPFSWDELAHAEPSQIETIKLAFFDSRIFQIPEKEEVVNSLIWRQQDAERNSIQMLAQSLYSQKELHGKNTSILQDMCFEKGQNWNDLSFEKKRGSLILRNKYVNDKFVVPYREGQWCTPETGEPNLGDLWYQRDNQSTFYPDKKGRLLEYSRLFDPEEFDWCDVKIEKIRNKWEVVDTPIFSKSRKTILDLI